MNYPKSTWKVRHACMDIFVTKFVSDMLKRWDLIEDKLQEMLHWCLEYKAMTNNITAMKLTFPPGINLSDALIQHAALSNFVDRLNLDTNTICRRRF